MKKQLFAIMLSLALLLGLTACTAAPNIQAPDTQTDPQATVPDAGQTGQAEDGEQSPADDSGTGKKTFSMGTTADYPPYEFIIINDKGEQEFVGIDIFLAQAIAEDMDAELKIVNMSFENLMLALDKGEVDCVIAALEKNEEREKVADFSEPYYVDQPPMVLVKQEHVQDYQTMEDFSGKKVGAQMSSTNADIVSNDMPGANLVALSSVTDLVNELAYGKCDAIVINGKVALEYAAANEDLAVAAVSLGEAAPSRVLVKKGDPSGVLESINETIASLNDSGKMDQLVETAKELSSQSLE